MGISEWYRHLRADLREMATEFLQGRELLLQMTRRDLKLRYKQTVMGFGWAIFTPVVNTALFTMVFTRVATIETPAPYPVYAYSGLAIWNFFRSSVQFSTTSLSSNVSLVTKVYFPRETLPLSAILVCCVDFLVSLSILVLLMAYYGIVPGAAILVVPVILLVQLVLTFAVGLLLAMANLFYRDVKYLMDAVLTLLMFATSVVYPIELVGGRLGTLLALNPLTPLIDGFRAAVLFNRLPDPLALGSVALASLLLLGVAWLLFHRTEFKFAENV